MRCSADNVFPYPSRLSDPMLVERPLSCWRFVSGEPTRFRCSVLGLSVNVRHSGP